MRGMATRKGALLNSGTLSPNPWDLTLWGRNVWSTMGGTRTEDRAPQGCDLSAASSAGMAGAASMPGPSQTQTLTPTDLSLLRAKNGLDKGVHFTGRRVVRKAALLSPTKSVCSTLSASSQ